MSPQLFVAISDHKAARIIDGSQRRVVLAAPAVRKESAAALIRASARLGGENVALIIDCDEGVFRLGYGDIEAVQLIRDAGCAVRQSSGLRIGVLACDEFAWVFAPTALYVEDEIHSDETPNAVALKGSDVDRLVAGMLPSVSVEVNATPVQVEIGHESAPSSLIESIQKALNKVPPVPFNVSRQVRVFQPYIQYVDIRLRGCAIQRRTVKVPKSIQGIAPNADLASRLKTTFDLIERASELSSRLHFLNK